MDQANSFNGPWAPGYQKAAEEYTREITREPSYISRDAIDCERVAIDEPWEPSNHILELIPNAKEVSVELITDASDLNAINKELIASRFCGLVVMGPVIHRKAKPSLIIITTKDKLYAIDPNDLERGIKFLRMKLADEKKKVQFWTTDGLNEADSLYHNYQIDLSTGSAKCCTGVHINLIKTLQRQPEAPLRLFPQLVAQKRHVPPRIERFERLVESWLDINQSDIAFEPSQLKHLKTRPLSMTAINVIKKRCILVRPLAKTLEDFSWLQANLMSRNSFRFLRPDLPSLIAMNGAPDARHPSDSSERTFASEEFLGFLDARSVFG